MEEDQKKALALTIGAIGASMLVYRLCTKEKSNKCFTISGTATASGSIQARPRSKEMELWIDRFEDAIELATLAYQAWQNVQKKGS